MAVGGFSERLAFLLELDPSNAIAGMRRVGDAADRELGKADDRINRLGGRMQAFGAGAVVAAGVAGRALFGFAQAFDEAEAESRKLDSALANAPQLAGATRDAFEALADQLQDTTTAEGDAVIGLEGMLGTLGRTQDEILELTPLIVDLATRYGLSFEQAGRLVNNAVEGNTTRLERLVGTIGEGETVTEALRRSVGGFAEGEAQTLSGQLTILKNNLGDVAEGIGGGVVGAVNDMIGPLKSGAEWFSRLDEGTQNTIGSFATYGTAAIGIAGASSFVIGSLMKMVDNFKAAKEAYDKFKAAIPAGTGGMLGLAAAIAAVGLTLDRLVTLNEATRSIEDFARASDDALVGMIDDAVARVEAFGLSADEVFSRFAETNIGVLARYRDELEATGRSTEAVDAALRAEADAQQRQAATAEAGTEAVDEFGNALDESTGATEENTGALEENRRLLEERTAAALSARGNELSLADAMLATADRLEAYNEVMNNGRATDRDRQQASIDLEQQFYAEAEAAGRAAADQAVASGNAAGAQSASVQAQIDALTRLAQNVGVGSPVWNGIQEHIAVLNAVPRDLETRIRLVNETVNAGTITTRGFGPSGAKAAGGYVTQPSERVGERGPEVVTDPAGHRFLVNGQGSHVTPTHALKSAPDGGGGGLYIENLNALDLSDAIRQLAAYQAWAAAGGI